MPGGIDPHTHFEFEFMDTKTVDDFYQGTKAAVAGGTTMIIDFVAARSEESLVEAYERYREMADQKVCCDYGLHVVVSSWNSKVNLREFLMPIYSVSCTEKNTIKSRQMYILEERSNRNLI